MPVKWVETRQVPIGDLNRYPGNARRGNMTEIRGSVRRYGQYRALVVRDTGYGLVVLAGNHTRDALEAEGHQDARCEIITCTDDEAQRILVADNKLSDMAGNDDAMLAELLDGLDADYAGTGYTDIDVAEIMRAGGFFADAATSFLDDLTFPPPRSGNGNSPPAAMPRDYQNPADSPGEPDRAWVQVAWLVRAEQRDLIQKAVNDARRRWDLATTAEAVAAICTAYLSGIPSPESQP